MSGFVTVVAASDVRAIKQRVNATVVFIGDLVARASSLDTQLREGWLAFAKTWADLFATPDDAHTASQHENALAMERKLREWMAILSSLCPGVPAPAPKRAVPLIPTWVTPNAVREAKNRLDPLVRELGARVAQTSSLESAFARGWLAFFQGWTTFAHEPEEWTHCTAQYDNALAYEDALSEWAEAFALATPRSPQSTVAPSPMEGPPPERPRGIPPGLPAPAYPPPPFALPAPAPAPSTSTMPTVLTVGAGAFVLAIALSKGRRP